MGLSGHLHTFRHTFISRALVSGIPEAIVRDWVGHVDRDILKLYTHIASIESQDAMTKLVGGIGGLKRAEASEIDQQNAEGSAHFQHTTEETKNG